jgi:very-short-patch-repair endonuclease
MTDITCIICGNVFHTTPSHSIGRKCCSVKCKAIFQKGKKTWNYGLTKETDKRVARISKLESITIKKQFKNGRASPKGMTGKKHTAKHILWLKTRFGGKNNPFYGKRHSKNTKQKIRMSVIRNETLKNKRYSFTRPEIALYSAMESKGIDFIKQYVLNNKFAVDAYIPKSNTLIQVDGNYWHNLDRVKKKDKSFNAYAKKCGYRVVRLWEKDIYENVDKCIESL